MPRPRRTQPRSSTSRRPIDTSDQGGWFTIRSILDERPVRGRVEYLVDWDDNTETGEAYSPTWICEVTDVAKDEWERLKSSRATEQRTSDLQQEGQQEGQQESQQESQQEGQQDSQQESQQPLNAQSSQDSQPPRPLNWRQQQRVLTRPAGASRRRRSITDDGNHSLIKRSRTRRSASPSEEPVPSFVSISSPASWDDLEDPADLEWTQRDLNPQQQLVVELQNKSDFDPSEYASQQNTESSGLSSQLIAELEDQDERDLFASQPSRQTVPDSQEPSGQTWTQDKHPADNSVSSPGALETQASLLLETQHSLHHQDSVQSGDGERSSDHSHGIDIPSHQLGLQDSFSTTSPSFNLATPATKPQSAQSPQRKQLTASPISSPVFLSQIAIAAASISSQNQESPPKSAVAETPSTLKENLHSTRPGADPAAESQDAQVFDIDPFASHVEAFSDSHDTPNTPNTPHGAAPDAIHTVSQPLPEHLSLMESEEANEPSNQTPPPSAIDEISQIFNLDRAMAEEASVPLPRDTSPGPSVRNAAPAEHDSTGPQILSNPGAMMPDASSNEHDVSTVSLADISKKPDLAGPALPLMPLLFSHDEPSSAVVESSGVSAPMGHQQEQESDDGSSEASQESIALKHIITLPFQASIRPLYDDTLLEFKREVTQFGAIFNSEVYVEPEETLVDKIDQMFSRLHNICDYPPDAIGGVLEKLPSDQLIKYCCDANPKFNFIYELLQGIAEETRVLIVARSTDILRLLYRLTTVLQIDCVCREIGELSSLSSPARVTLILPETNVEEDDFDVVIGYDHSFGSSEIGKKLEPEIPEAKSPLVLILVTTHSIEHIDLYISDDLLPLERKNALLSAMVRARQLVSDPDRGYPEPHELASLFLDYLNGHVETVHWEPISIPEDVMDIYLSSQSRSQLPVEATLQPENARKRKLDESDDEDAKRMRMFPHKQSTVQTNEPPVPDDVKSLLDSANIEESAIKSSALHISVPVSVLQALAEQNAELKRQIEAADREAQYKDLIATLETRVKEYQRTSAKMYSTQRAAVEDRIKFERECRNAEAKLQQATEKAQRDAEKAQEKIADLEATVVRLTSNPSNPEEPSPLAKTQTLLQQAEDKIAMLEKRLDNAHKDADYARSLYQDATTTSSALRGEKDDLKEQVADLSKKTEETLGKVHQIQAENTTKIYLRQIRDVKAQLREREIELDCTKEELRTLKNGRRETRQASVPRSPRMGMMSPRTGRANYGSAGGSTSRGTSPAPTSGEVIAGMQFLSQPPGNGRWNHLRD